MRRAALIATLLAAMVWLGVAVPGIAQEDAAAPSDATPLDVTVTSDSPAGWSPSEALVGEALDVVERYIEALDEGDYPRAYAMITADNQKATSAVRFREESRKFNELAGKLVRRRVVASTWSKNPRGAPEPGVYAAFDLAAQFTNVDRQCGSIVLYQPAAGGAFKVLRSENYYLDNRTAQQIELTRSHQALLDEWAKIGAACPSFSWDAASPAP
jgi:hypothetical protein